MTFRIAPALLLAPLAACVVFDPTDEPPSDVRLTVERGLIRSQIEAPGENCPEGGVRYQTGVDENENDTLDDDEVRSTEYVCDGPTGDIGPAGAPTLLAAVPASDVQCDAGGTRFLAGRDADADGLLDDAEVETTAVVCDGVTPVVGTTLDDVNCLQSDSVPVFSDGFWTCEPRADYTGNDFALSNQACGDGLVMTGVADDGTPACASDLDTLPTLVADCIAGQALKFDGFSFACGTDETALPGTDTLQDLDCQVDEIAKWDGAQWVCAVDVDSLQTLICATGQLVRYDGIGFECADQVDEDTLAGLTCAGGEVAKWGGFAWECAPDVDTDTLAGLTCVTGEVAKWNGFVWACAPDDDEDTLAALPCLGGQVAKRAGAAWVCAADIDTDTDTLDALPCVDGQIAKRSGAAWVCAADDSTTGSWRTDGNPGTGLFLGTTDTEPLELRVDERRALLLVPAAAGQGSSTVLGSEDNAIATGVRGAAIGGGGTELAPNSVLDDYGTVAGGIGNQAGDGATTTDEIYASVGGGEGNAARATHATIGGGVGNSADGVAATVPGGEECVADGDGSFAAGYRAQAVHDGAFVWADQSSTTALASVADNTFIARAAGGTTIYSDSGATTGVELPPGTGAWAALSDRNVKHDVVPVDGEAILAQLAGVAIFEWSYIANSDGVRHMGPMAQDFHAAFGLGHDDRHISTLDPDGVSLAAIKALSARTDALATENEALRAENDALAARLARIEAALASSSQGGAR